MLLCSVDHFPKQAPGGLSLALGRIFLEKMRFKENPLLGNKSCLGLLAVDCGFLRIAESGQWF